MTLPNQDRHIGADVNVLLFTSTGGALVTNILGQAKKSILQLKRVYANVTGAADEFSSQRAVRWGLGKLQLQTFAQVAGSVAGQAFANGATGTIVLQYSVTGETWQLDVTCDEFTSTFGLVETIELLTLTVVGVPFHGTNGGPVSAVPLGI